MSERVKELKCVVWDLDDTLWDGILLESHDVTLRPGVVETIQRLDERGILQSIASKNNYKDAIGKLELLGLRQFFLYPEIHWEAKSSSIGRIREKLNIGMDTIAFLDDSPFEREEVQSIHKEVVCIDSTEYASDFTKLLANPRLQPRFVTRDAARRRLMYLEDQERHADERSFEGPKEEFLAGLQMQFVISHAQEEDLQRAEELTVRTNQLNATGRTYSYEDLDRFRLSKNYRLLVCELTDRYGSYGKIGLALIDVSSNARWRIKLLLMSCRVMSRGVGTILLSYILQEARAQGLVVEAEFVPTDRNRMMYITYKFANFKESGIEDGGVKILYNDLSVIQPLPPYVNCVVPLNGLGRFSPGMSA